MSASRLDKEQVEGTEGICCAHSAPKGYPFSDSIDTISGSTCPI